jgi:hypothetical protein
MTNKHWPILALLPVIPTLTYCTLPYCMDVEPALVITVNCDKGESLADALQKVEPGTTVRNTGTCQEEKPVGITVDGVTLEGGTVVGVPDKPVISIQGARGVTVKNSRVTGGAVGIEIMRGAIVRLRNVTAEKNGTGIRVDGRPVAQTNKKQASTRQDTGATWRYLPSRLIIDSEKPASKRPNLLAANGSPTFLGAALPVTGSEVITTTLDICDSDYSRNPVGDGLQAIHATITIECDDNHFDGNGGSGFQAEDNSTVTIMTGAFVISENHTTGTGFRIKNSTMKIDNGTLHALSNKQGVVVESGGFFKLTNSAVVDANNNVESGIVLNDSEMQAWTSEVKTLSNTQKYGVEVSNKSVASLLFGTVWESMGNGDVDVRVDPTSSEMVCIFSSLTKGSNSGAGTLACP